MLHWWHRFFIASNDLYLLPLNYGVYNDTSDSSYTIWFDYIDNTLQVYNTSGDPTVTITFVATFVSGTDTFANNIYSVDKLTENNSGNGVTIASKVIMNGGDVNIGTDNIGTNTVSIGTDSASGGRLVDIGNTVSGSSTVINGVIETPNPSQDTIAYNNSASITWTDVNSIAQRIGKVCHVVIQATLTAVTNLTQGTIYDFFSVTPTGKYSSNYVVVGSLYETTVNAIGAVIGVSSSADFRLIMPINLSATNSTTIYASVTYISS